MKRENRWESCSRQTNREEVMEDIKTLINQQTHCHIHYKEQEADFLCSTGGYVKEQRRLGPQKRKYGL